jgi:hypothetical protein
MPTLIRKPAIRSRPAPLRPEQPPTWMMRFLRQLYQPGILFPMALAFAAIVTWPYLPAWAPDLSTDPVYQVRAECLRLPESHPWIPADFATRVLERAGATADKPLSLLQDGLAERLARSFALEPWVREVQRVELRRDGTIHVELTYRKPVLMVATARGMYAVDEEGTLLPPEDFRAEDVRRFPLARNPGSLPTVGAGHVWADTGVRGAARLAAALAPTTDDADPWRSLGLAAVLIPPQPPAASKPQPLTYELLTVGGSRIIWGHAPGADSLEPSTEQKLARLAYYREQCNGFETAQGPARIDIRDIEVIYAGALTEERR